MRLAELLALGSAEDRAQFDGVALGYTETFGSPALRAEIARTYGTVRPEHLLCFAGAEEAIYAAMRVLLKSRDHAIVITPNYQAAETVPLSICEVTGSRSTSTATGISTWMGCIPRFGRIRSSFPSTFRTIPPARSSRAALDALVDICRNRGIWLFGDEVYRLIERDPSLRLPQAVDVYERGISLNVMSKAYGLPGLRIGWLACRDRAMLVRFERFKHFLSICNSAPSEALACIALKARGTILARNRKIVRDNVDVVECLFRRLSATFRLARAGRRLRGLHPLPGRRGSRGIYPPAGRGIRRAFSTVESLPLGTRTRAGELPAGGFRSQARCGRPRGPASVVRAFSIYIVDKARMEGV